MRASPIRTSEPSANLALTLPRGIRSSRCVTRASTSPCSWISYCAMRRRLGPVVDSDRETLALRRQLSEVRRRPEPLAVPVGELVGPGEERVEPDRTYAV